VGGGQHAKQRVELRNRLFLCSVVVDDGRGQADLFFGGHLRVNAGAGFRLGQVISCHQPLELRLRADADYPDLVKPGLDAAFKEQGDVRKDHGMGAPQLFHLRVNLVKNQGVKNSVEFFAVFVTVKDELAQLFSG